MSTGLMGSGSTRPIVVGGVSGTGKTTAGRAVAERLSRPFLDADDLHPESSVAKMAAGIPLTDEDRWPWLDDVAAWLAAHPDGVCACSALRRAHRDRLRAGAPDVRFLMLTAPSDILSDRLQHRRGHYMPSSLLDSQLATYEPIQSDESADTVDVSGTPEEVVVGILGVLNP